ncbi:DUF2783 domain-containing protein [Puniceibacterium sp. IMCC21224]|uniref:DUF2783 domain-containing protein n=1 Tax=Puniceibacterium sp. IMCC21224 TaxID=1618204 RepID=UPI00064E0ABE|nr:DUF2783 domain-containing protein [Puniceibacterium sp. IMCC21224]KMK67998.1 Protein of unknown function (DUF2783) [Puniceibacterium sp. IMCC21224]
MAKQIYDSQLGDATDDAYAVIMAAHDGLSEAQSHALNVRLVLLMANAIGSARAVEDLCQTARAYVD